MVQLARLVRWWLGLQAILLVTLSVTLFGTLSWRLIQRTRTVLPRPAYSQTLHAPTKPPEIKRPLSFPSIIPSTRGGLIAVIAIYFGSFVVSTVAWWALRKGWRSARIWALSASGLCLFNFGIGTAFGIAGLIAFWREDVVRQMSLVGPNKPPERISGDGTSKFLDILVQGLAIAGWIAARYLWDHWAVKQGLDDHGGVPWIVFIGAIYVAVIYHEAGHFLAGLATDMSLRSVAIGPLAAQIEGGRWRFKFNAAGILGGGAVGMVPLHLRDFRRRTVYMIAAGPVFSLTFGLLAVILALEAPHSPWEPAWLFFAMTGSIGLCDFVLNLIPFRPEGAYSDGAHILQLIRGGPWTETHLAFSMVGSSLVTPLRPSQFDLPLLERVAAFHQSGPHGALVRLFIALHHVEGGRYQPAIDAWRKAATLDLEPSAGRAAEYTFLEAAIAHDLEKAREWWQKVEKKGDCRREVNYWRARAALLWLEGDPETARQALSQADTFAQQQPAEGAYAYDRWTVEMLRRTFSAGPTTSVVRQAEDSISAEVC